MNIFSMVWLLASGFIILFVAAHITITRRFCLGPKRQIFVQTGLFCIFAPAVVWISYSCFLKLGVGFVSDSWALFTALAFFSGIFGLSLTFYAAVDHSVRIRLCVEFYKNRQGFSLQTIETQYNLKTAYERRLHKIISGGFATMQNGRLHLTQKGRRVTHLLNFFKALYRTS